MNPLIDVDLQTYNTLAVPARAQYFVQVHSVAELVEALIWARQKNLPTSILGGGSNVILPSVLPGLTIKIDLQGCEQLSTEQDSILVRVGAGERWHDFVQSCLQNQFFGLENLALIPGTVGAAPVQNIGAYGVEVGNFIERVEGIEYDSQKAFALSAEQCLFSYRDSVFKKLSGPRRIITHVVFRLLREFSPNLTYPALAAELVDKPINAQGLFDAVCLIRSTKLPDPKDIPNCGSFFKNPIVENAEFHRLLSMYPNMPHYDTHCDSHRKLAAAWLIDQAGWRGRALYGVVVHHAQALVIANPERCSAEKVLALACEVQKSVHQRFGVQLELEPQILGG